jgi:hypothetical protein
VERRSRGFAVHPSPSFKWRLWYIILIASSRGPEGKLLSSCDEPTVRELLVPE